jgi:hypothetical protein
MGICLTNDHSAIAEWAHVLVAFVNSKYGVSHRLVVIGHAAGASAWLAQRGIGGTTVLLIVPQDVFHEVLSFPDTLPCDYLIGT